MSLQTSQLSERVVARTPAAHSSPRLSIGMPIYNGERFVAEAIESILAQTFSDFEVIIGDNASSDDTEEICRSYAALDGRVCYYRHEMNRGAAPNFNFTFARARGTYFKWAAHDDLLSPGYLEACVSRLEEDPGVSLAHSGVRRIDEAGREIDRFTLDRRFGAADEVERLQAVLAAYDFSAIWGVMRRSLITTAKPIPLFTGSDRLFLAAMALRGRPVFVPECLFGWRAYQGCYRQNEMNGQERGHALRWWDTSKRHWPLRNTMSLYLLGTAALLRTPLPLVTRCRCLKAYWAWAARPAWRKGVRLLRPPRRSNVELET